MNVRPCTRAARLKQSRLFSWADRGLRRAQGTSRAARHLVMGILSALCTHLGDSPGQHPTPGCPLTSHGMQKPCRGGSPHPGLYRFPLRGVPRKKAARHRLWVKLASAQNPRTSLCVDQTCGCPGLAAGWGHALQSALGPGSRHHRLSHTQLAPAALRWNPA